MTAFRERLLESVTKLAASTHPSDPSMHRAIATSADRRVVSGHGGSCVVIASTSQPLGRHVVLDYEAFLIEAHGGTTKNAKNNKIKSKEKGPDKEQRAPSRCLLRALRGTSVAFV
jgi:hypothetical protein